MRNAALVLGIIAGVSGMIVGFFAYGYSVVVEQHGDLNGLVSQYENVELVRVVALLSPMLAIAGGAMARARALWGGLLMLISAAGMYAAFGFGVFTMFPIGFVALGGLLAVAAGKPDEEKAHF